MAKIFKPHDYQTESLKWLIEQTVVRNLGAGYFLDPGSGKTVVTLTWIKALRMAGLIDSALIVAPLRVVYDVWPKQIAEWSHTNKLTYSVVHGNKKERELAADSGSDILITNPDSLVWLVEHFKAKLKPRQRRKLPFNAMVLDESSLYKTWGSKRTKAIRTVAKGCKYRVLLTGTPVTKNVIDLFAQTYLLDMGKTLGTAITHFHREYCYRGGYEGREWIPQRDSLERVQEKIAPLTFRLPPDSAVKLPELIINDVWVDLPKQAYDTYKTLEKEAFIELQNDELLTPKNAGAKYGLCLQVANGGYYVRDDQGKILSTEVVHAAKTNAALEIASELNGKPVMTAYQYNHDLERLQKAFKGYKTKVINGATNDREASDLVDQWNSDKIEVLFIQPKALSHGVNMQLGSGRDLIWYGLTDNLDTYIQLNARIYRQGVKSQVRIHRILARKTIDRAVLAHVEDKNNTQKNFLYYLEKYFSSN